MELTAASGWEWLVHASKTKSKLTKGEQLTICEIMHGEPFSVFMFIFISYFFESVWGI